MIRIVTPLCLLLWNHISFHLFLYTLFLFPFSLTSFANQVWRSQQWSVWSGQVMQNVIFFCFFLVGVYSKFPICIVGNVLSFYLLCTNRIISSRTKPSIYHTLCLVYKINLADIPSTWNLDLSYRRLGLRFKIGAWLSQLVDS